MQPYFLPYIGYFQLMSAVDKLVLLDDVNFINGGWINRNRIAINGKPRWLTIPLAKASQNRFINEIAILDHPSWRRKMTRTVELIYRSAPFAHKILPLFSELLKEAKGSLSAVLFHQLRRVADYIGIDTEIQVSSTMYPKNGRSGQQRILDICRREQASTYINLPGGRNLYDAALFASAGIELLFLDPNFPALKLQYSGDEGPRLSILDLLMYNPVPAIREAANAFQLSSVWCADHFQPDHGP